MKELTTGLFIIFLSLNVYSNEFCDLTDAGNYEEVDNYVIEKCKDEDILSYASTNVRALQQSIYVRARYCDFKKKITEIKYDELLPPGFICILKKKDIR